MAVGAEFFVAFLQALQATARHRACCSPEKFDDCLLHDDEPFADRHMTLRRLKRGLLAICHAPMLRGTLHSPEGAYKGPKKALTPAEAKKVRKMAKQGHGKGPPQQSRLPPVFALGRQQHPTAFPRHPHREARLAPTKPEQFG